MRLRWQSQDEDQAHIKAILTSILEAVAHILHEIGPSMPKSEFEKLTSYSTAIRQWGSK
ncbi:MAG: hypothetical protein AB7F66_10980 [Bacteriovoracia bacterium]